MLQNVTFKSKIAMVEYLRGLSHNDKVSIVRQFGYDVDAIDSDAKIGVLADYIVQGHNIGLDNDDEIVSYANNMTNALILKMPHLGKPNAPKVMALPAAPQPVVRELQVADSDTDEESVPVAVPVVAKVKVKHPDGTIVERVDRGGWEFWMNGKAEAFRDSIEKCKAFAKKKYQIDAVVLCNN